MNEVRNKILHLLQKGPVAAPNGTLTIAGVNPETLHETLVELCNIGQVKVRGAPNMNSDFGADPEIFYLPQHEHLARQMPEY